jgi:hypothetical protein
MACPTDGIKKMEVVRSHTKIEQPFREPNEALSGVIDST